MKIDINTDGEPLSVSFDGDTKIQWPESEKPEVPKTSDETVRVGFEGDYKSLQAALDDNTPGGGGPRPRFHIEPSYSPSEDDLPVEVKYKATISGDRSPIDVPDDQPWLWFKTEGNRSPGIHLQDLWIDGGERAVVIAGSRFGVYEGVSFKNTNGHAVEFKSPENDEGDELAPNSHYFTGCDFEGISGNAVHAPMGCMAHEIRFIGCNMLDNDGYHIWASDIAALAVISTGLQKAGKNAVMARGTMATTVRDCYIEDNCLNEDKYYHLFFNEETNPCTAVTVEGNYFNGFSKAVGAVHFGSDACTGATVKSNDIRGFTAKGISVFDGNYNIDVHRESNTFKNIGGQDIAADDDKSIVMSDGVIGAHTDGVDLTEPVFTGEHVRGGQRALYRGNVAPNGLAVYLDGSWQSQVNGKTIK